MSAEMSTEEYVAVGRSLCADAPGIRFGPPNNKNPRGQFRVSRGSGLPGYFRKESGVAPTSFSVEALRAAFAKAKDVRRRQQTPQPTPDAAPHVVTDGPTRRQQRRQRSDKYDRRRSGPRNGSTPENQEADFGDFVESIREVPEWTEYKVIGKTTIDSWIARMGQLCLDVLDGFAPATVITNDEVPERWHRDARRLLKGYGALKFEVERWFPKGDA